MKKNTTTANQLTVEMWAIARVKPYEKNARKLSPAAIDKVATSLKTFGWRQPCVVDKKGVLVAGHTRWKAAMQLGMTEVPVHVAANLTPAQIRQYRLMDNRSHQESEWDLALLGPELLELQALDLDLSLTGFDADELKMFMADPTVGLTDPDDCPAPQAEAISKLGDLWCLGEHRLLCGDSTSVTDVERLMAGEKADMVFTDPPYNVSYNPDAAPTNSDKRRTKVPLGTIKSDKMSDENFLAFLRAVTASMITGSKPGAAAYVCHADSEGLNFRTAFQEGYHLSSVLIWSKNNFSIGRKDYHWMHEPILYGWPLDSVHTWHGDRSQTSVWKIAKDDVNAYVHPTQKPVELPRRAISNSSKAGAVVLDLFGGSGSTLIACVQSGRSARLMELDPHYADVICRRFIAFTGKQATLESDGRTFAELEAERKPKSAAA